MTRLADKNEACKLRGEEGLSIKKIARKLSVSISTVSKWVRDIELTEEQKEKLQMNCYNGGYVNGQRAMHKKHLDLRKQYQEQGCQLAKEKNIYHAIGCMLYWAEGNKCKNSVKMNSSEIDMLRMFLQFLFRFYNIQIDDIKISINCYDDVYSIKQIEEYWLTSLDLPDSCLNKTTVNNRPVSSQSLKKGKSYYGVCRLTVNRTDIVQSIFGGIKEYAGIIDENRWLG